MKLGDIFWGLWGLDMEFRGSPARECQGQESLPAGEELEVQVREEAGLGLEPMAGCLRLTTEYDVSHLFSP